MRPTYVIFLVFVGCQSAVAADSLCLSKYKAISKQFYVYNEKSATSNAVMDKIASSGESNIDVSQISPPDARAWRVATEQTDKITDDLKQSRARLNALVSGLPASTFQ